MTFGEKLKEARTRRGMTITHLARKCGVAPCLIACYERDEHTPNVLRAFDMAQILGITVDTLCDGSDKIERRYFYEQF